MLITQLSCATNTAVQHSKSLSDSKKNGLFYAAYYEDSNSYSGFSVEEAWAERVWFNEYENGRLVKDVHGSYQLCFKVNQNPDFPFSFENIHSWLMKDSSGTGGVGIQCTNSKNGVDGVYRYYWDGNDVPPETVSFKLYLLEEDERVLVGRLIFRKNVDKN